MASRYFEGAAHAALYAKFRPSPPPTLIKAVVDFLTEKIPQSSLSAAVDVGCGSGQSTHPLAPYFTTIKGLDVSPEQILQANAANTIKNVTYSVSGAETIPLPSASQQLVTSCQACHWFNMPAFYKEADRVLQQNGVVAIYGYTLPRSQHPTKATQLDVVMDELYDTTREFFGVGRLDLDAAYTHEKFLPPYPGILRDDTTHGCKVAVSVRDLQGYVSSWSAMQRYTAAKGEAAKGTLLQNFVDRLLEVTESSTTAEDTPMELRFPYFLLMAHKPVACT